MKPEEINPELADTARAETTAIVGLCLHLLLAAGFLISAYAGGVFSYYFIGVQTGIGALFFLASLLQLRFRRLAVNETFERAETERKRKAQGLASLFADDEVPPAARNLAQYNNYFAPALSVLLSLLLLLPAGYTLYAIGTQGAGIGGFFFGDLPRSIALPYGFVPLFGAFFLFVLGVYASGLCANRQWRPLRAGAGYALSSAGFITLCGLCLLLGGKITFYPERVIAILTVLWCALQSVEILLNVVLDHYRPRLPDIEQRPAYDSRLSGLLAEPQSIFKTFANTLDYQFGFRVSDTWFFHFIERAFAPLLLILIFSFYFLTCFVVVRPGQVAVIERFGAPRGFSSGDVRDWEAFAALNPPLPEGVHLKWPWPIERARVVNRSRLSLITLGYGSTSEEESRRKADELRQTMAEWDKEHVKDEILYLMPLPEEMREANVATGATEAVRSNFVFISGSFSVEYRIGSDADVYRYIYNYSDPAGMVRAVAEREFTSFLAGADFWEVAASQNPGMREELFTRISQGAAELGVGVEIVNIGISNFHPPAGEVGKAFLEVVASRLQKQTEIYSGEIEAIKVVGLAPAEANRLRSEAEGYRFRRQVVSEAEGHWFRNQLKAHNTAPGIYLNMKQMQMLEAALANARKVFLPQDTTMIMDDSKAADPDSINSILARELNKLSSGN